MIYSSEQPIPRLSFFVVSFLGIAALSASYTDAAVRTLDVDDNSQQHYIKIQKAVSSPTKSGKIEGLIDVLKGDDLPLALEAMESLASMGKDIVPRLVSEMRRMQNNWLIGGALVRMGSEAVEPLIELLVDADEETAVDCIYLLGEIRDPRALPALIRYLEDEREKVRLHAVTAVLNIGGTKAVERVLSLLSRENGGTETFIVECLLRNGRKSIESMLQNLKSMDMRVRRETAYILGGIQDTRAVYPLVETLRDEDPETRRNAAYSLGEMADMIETDEETDQVLQGLADLLFDPSESLRDAGREALVNYGELAVPTLIEIAERNNLDALILSLNALREIGSPKAEDALISFLKHPNDRVRVSAVSGLIAVGTGKSVEPLLDALRDEDLRWFATLALQKVGAENAEMFFVINPGDPTISLRLQILVHLGSSIVPVLTDFLGDANVGKNAAALWLLGEIGDPSAIQDVAFFLPDPVLGSLAGRSLGKMGAKGLDLLADYVSSPPNDKAAVNAIEALASFKEPKAWETLESAIKESLFRKVRIRAAVLVAKSNDQERVGRLRAYLNGEGSALKSDIEEALQDETRIY